MYSQISLDDAAGTPVLLHGTPQRGLTKATGLIGIGALRVSRRVRPQAHGAIDDTRYEDGRLMALEGLVKSTVSPAAAYSELRTITTAALQTLDNAPALLKWTEEGAGGLALQRLVQLADSIDPPIEETGQTAVLRYQAQFYAEDPRAYSQTLTTATGTALSAAGGGLTFPRTFPITFTVSGGGTVSFTNAGPRPTPVVLTIVGRAVNPQVICTTTGQRITLVGTVEAGTFLQLDTQQRTIKIGGTTSRLNFLDASLSQWMEAPSGVSQWQLVAADFDATARLDIAGRAAW